MRACRLLAQSILTLLAALEAEGKMLKGLFVLVWSLVCLPVSSDVMALVARKFMGVKDGNDWLLRFEQFITIC